MVLIYVSFIACTPWGRRVGPPVMNHFPETTPPLTYCGPDTATSLIIGSQPHDTMSLIRVRIMKHVVQFDREVGARRMVYLSKRTIIMRYTESSYLRRRLTEKEVMCGWCALARDNNYGVHVRHTSSPWERPDWRKSRTDTLSKGDGFGHVKPKMNAFLWKTRVRSNVGQDAVR